jgi:hypothetical protein
MVASRQDLEHSRFKHRVHHYDSQKPGNTKSFRLSQVDAEESRSTSTLTQCVCCLPGVLPAPCPAASQKPSSQMSAHEGRQSRQTLAHKGLFMTATTADMHTQQNMQQHA